MPGHPGTEVRSRPWLRWMAARSRRLRSRVGTVISEEAAVLGYGNSGGDAVSKSAGEHPEGAESEGEE
jgi:hypothetical protein